MDNHFPHTREDHRPNITTHHKDITHPGTGGLYTADIHNHSIRGNIPLPHNLRHPRNRPRQMAKTENENAKVLLNSMGLDGVCFCIFGVRITREALLPLVLYGRKGNELHVLTSWIRKRKGRSPFFIFFGMN